MKAAIVIIGDEILLGRVTDTNSGAIARALDKIGLSVKSVFTVSDKEDDISTAVYAALKVADIVITTGGLGPTKDDITKNVFLKIFGGELIRDKSVTENIITIFRKRNLKINQLTLDQALVPSTARIIQNRFGTAPIMVFRNNDKTVITMPGVPAETEGMLGEVMDYILSVYPDLNPLNHSTRIVTGLPESALAQNLADFEAQLPKGYKLAYLPDFQIIKLRLDAPSNDNEFEKVTERLDQCLNSVSGLKVLSKSDVSLARLVIDNLKEHNLSLSTAESCTGGNIARLITSVAGSSAVYNGSVISYANSAKTSILDVGSETIRDNGAVSRQVVIQMVEGACSVLQTDCAVATSGVAGPDGGTPQKPVGTVWIAVKTPKGVFANEYHFNGNRSAIITRASYAALICLLSVL